MTGINPSDSSFVDGRIDNKVQLPRIGRIQEVFEHTEADDKTNFEVDVQIIGEDVQHRTIPYQHESNNEIVVPTVGDKVIVEYRDGQVLQPIARNIVYTNKDRPPLGRAGMWRKRIDSGDSPAGPGSLYIESFTEYDVDPAQTDPQDHGSVEESWVRIGKKVQDDAGEDGEDLPFEIEVLDAPASDEAHIKLELNKVDGMDSSVSWGLKLDVKTGQFKLIDSEGYGIVSDGSGNFTWHHEDIDFSQGSTDSL